MFLKLKDLEQSMNSFWYYLKEPQHPLIYHLGSRLPFVSTETMYNCCKPCILFLSTLPHWGLSFNITHPQLVYLGKNHPSCLNLPSSHLAPSPTMTPSCTFCAFPHFLLSWNVSFPSLPVPHHSPVHCLAVLANHQY